jgi:hypothetical protein
VVGQAKRGSRRTALLNVTWNRLGGREGSRGRVVGNVLKRWADRWWRHNELGVASAEAHINRARCEVTSDLARSNRQCLQQNEPGGRLERRGETLGKCTGFVTTRFSGNFQLALEIVDVVR